MKQTSTFLLVLFCLALSTFSKAQVSGIVFRDFNGSGAKDNSATFNEPFLAGVTVKAYDASDALVGTATTSAAGAYSFTGLTLPLRIEFTGLPTGFYTGPKGAANATSVQFYTATSTTADFAANYPDEYSQATPSIAIVTQNPNVLGTGVTNAIKTLPYGNTGDITTDLVNLNSSINPAAGVAMGSLWGMAYQPSQDRLYTAAFMRRHALFGTGVEVQEQFM
jgi:hypothetical protein